jgi:hypothetical protein
MLGKLELLFVRRHSKSGESGPTGVGIRVSGCRSARGAFYGQLHDKLSHAIDALPVNASTVPDDNLVSHGKANANAVWFPRDERLEELVGNFAGRTGAGVGHC